MKMLVNCLAVAGGGCMGTLARYWVSLLCARLFGTSFPIGTFVINITGSFFLGWFLTIVSTRVTLSDPLRLGVAVGFTGAYTTFSTYMFESHALLADGAEIKAMANLIGSVALGLLAVRLGMVAAHQF